jgi:hypothetical protein
LPLKIVLRQYFIRHNKAASAEDTFAMISPLRKRKARYQDNLARAEFQ